MKAKLLLGLCALLAFPGCFDPIVGTECAKGYSRCGNQCVIAGTCELADAGAQETGLADVGFHEPDTAKAETFTSDASDDHWSPLDADNNHAEAGPDTSGSDDVGTTILDDAGLDPFDGTVEDTSSTPEDAPLGGDTESFDVAVDAPLPIPDATLDRWVSPDRAPALDEGSDATDSDAGVDAPSLETGGLMLDGADATQDDGGLGDADGGDAQDGDAEGEEAPPLVCEGTLVNCGGQCMDLLNNPNTCGTCDNACASGVCNNGECLVCTPEQTVCGRVCVNTGSDPDNCGGCGTPCSSGLCSGGVCEAADTGRVIVIGHDYTFANYSVKKRLLGNAVFLWPVNPVQLLLYASDATAAGISGADAAIADVASATGRQVSKTYATSASVPALLPSADVFLIYAQTNASNEVLNQLGTEWASDLTTFVGRGGTVIVLDADQTGNAGTVQILASAGLLNLTRQASASGNVTCNVTARGDALATGLSRSYWCQDYSTTFTLGESSEAITSVVEAVVGDAESAPVVISKIF